MFNRDITLFNRGLVSLLDLMIRTTEDLVEGGHAVRAAGSLRRSIRIHVR
jgi:hypothetical protein